MSSVSSAGQGVAGNRSACTGLLCCLPFSVAFQQQLPVVFSFNPVLLFPMKCIWYTRL